MKGFTKFYRFGRKTRITSVYKARSLVEKIPEQYKKRTRFNENLEEEEYILSNEEYVKELLKNYREYKSESRLEHLFKRVFTDLENYEYAEYIENLQHKKVGTEESFYDKYLYETYKGKTIKEYLEEFKIGIIKDKDEMNKILSEFKKINEKYTSSGSS